MLLAAEAVAKLCLAPPYETLAQVALKFSVQPALVSSLLLGARTPGQVNGLLKTLSLPDLSQKLLDYLEQKYGDETLRFNPEDRVPQMMKRT